MQSKDYRLNAFVLQGLIGENYDFNEVECDHLNHLDILVAKYDCDHVLIEVETLSGF